MGKIGNMAIFADAEMAAFIDDVDVVGLADLADEFAFKPCGKVRFSTEMVKFGLAYLSKFLLSSPPDGLDGPVDHRIAHSKY